VGVELIELLYGVVGTRDNILALNFFMEMKCHNNGMHYFVVRVRVRGLTSTIELEMQRERGRRCWFVGSRGVASAPESLIYRWEGGWLAGWLAGWRSGTGVGNASAGGESGVVICAVLSGLTGGDSRCFGSSVLVSV
jgi:hypothetical protein